VSDNDTPFASVYDGSLALFVEARLADDEKARGINVEAGWGCCCGRCDPKLTAYVANWCPARVGREIAAHRRILSRFRRAHTELTHADLFHEGFRGELLAASKASALALADVAGTWSEHPDFRPEWRDFAALDREAPNQWQAVHAPSYAKAWASVIRQLAEDTGMPTDLVSGPNVWAVPEKHRSGS
jgi:hypothetical protein